ncbi:MAG: AsnC family transcriptional regulator [Alphaproteobacteria bacterium]|jgi:DNA-binding Lrp family transcriptional regulator|nr:AsnC family transcriptional regulator [Alphaproteobacteria bacterium]MDP6812817.1 AsnC family transcriptional regulator [Alphaproteobacteria bacterium]
MTGLDDIDRRIIVATQAGLPLVADPYRAVAEELGLAADEVMRRLRAMLDAGVIRRIGAVPNHYALGYRANGMSVWDVPEADIGDLGARVGALDFVSHCYHRPRHPPQWPYNLFAMVHGRDRDEVARMVARIAALLGPADRGHEILYSTRILKKTGLRLVA